MDTLPPIGLGTWQNTDPEQCAESVRMALEMGYRHVDTAHFYGNEAAVGEGIARADVPREEIFVATKVHEESDDPGYEDIAGAAEVSLERMGLDYLDLLYIHWPIGSYDPEETMPQFDPLREAGTIRHVGVSNFEPAMVDAAREAMDSPLFANQVELHPLLPQDHLVEHAQARDHYLVAYSPLARGEVFDVPEIQAVAEQHGVSAAQVSLAWVTRKDSVVAVPKATSEAHLRDNLGATDLELDPEDVERIDGIDREERYVERSGAPWKESA